MHKEKSDFTAGRRGGLNMNVLSAFETYADQMLEDHVELSNVYWLLAHKPCPGERGGCHYDDLTFAKRDREFDDMSYGEASKRARDAVQAHDDGAPAERNCDAGDMLAAATLVADRYEAIDTDEDDDMYAGVDMFLDD
jgi:hypothetical protein